MQPSCESERPSTGDRKKMRLAYTSHPTHLCNEIRTNLGFSTAPTTELVSNLPSYNNNAEFPPWSSSRHAPTRCSRWSWLTMLGSKNRSTTSSEFVARTSTTGLAFLPARPPSPRTSSNRPLSLASIAILAFFRNVLIGPLLHCRSQVALAEPNDNLAYRTNSPPAVASKSRSTERSAPCGNAATAGLRAARAALSLRDLEVENFLAGDIGLRDEATLQFGNDDDGDKRTTPVWGVAVQVSPELVRSNKLVCEPLAQSTVCRMPFLSLTSACGLHLHSETPGETQVALHLAVKPTTAESNGHRTSCV
mmetsp:Transcript_48119/g.154098  ORF Transcript_48119/g.154098 Transcript_48119/m.154098 type:complete len:307 (+) Transcript_48119:81-1001(+)